MVTLPPWRRYAHSKRQFASVGLPVRRSNLTSPPTQSAIRVTPARDNCPPPAASTVEICELLAYGYCHTCCSQGLELGVGPHRHAWLDPASDHLARMRTGDCARRFEDSA